MKKIAICFTLLIVLFGSCFWNTAYVGSWESNTTSAVGTYYKVVMVLEPSSFVFQSFKGSSADSMYSYSELRGTLSVSGSTMIMDYTEKRTRVDAVSAWSAWTADDSATETSQYTVEDNDITLYHPDFGMSFTYHRVN